MIYFQTILKYFVLFVRFRSVPRGIKIGVLDGDQKTKIKLCSSYALRSVRQYTYLYVVSYTDDYLNAHSR